VEGETARNAAKSTGYSPSVRNNATRGVLGSAAIRQQVEAPYPEMHAEVVARLASTVEKTAYLERLVDDEHAPVPERAQASIALLNRSGHCLPSEIGPKAELVSTCGSTRTAQSVYCIALALGGDTSWGRRG